ncbi:MAG: hypothetical protein COB61_010230 [Thiotrichales bacterium]|nr:hypothetical protein [Thiotrichales bacterium]
MAYLRYLPDAKIPYLSQKNIYLSGRKTFLQFDEFKNNRKYGAVNGSVSYTHSVQGAIRDKSLTFANTIEYTNTGRFAQIY